MRKISVGSIEIIVELRSCELVHLELTFELQPQLFDAVQHDWFQLMQATRLTALPLFQIGGSNHLQINNSRFRIINHLKKVMIGFPALLTGHRRIVVHFVR